MSTPFIEVLHRRKKEYIEIEVYAAYVCIETYKLPAETRARPLARVKHRIKEAIKLRYSS